MKFKFLCLVLAVVTMLAVLTSCSGGGKGVEDIANAATRETQTLVVYLMSEIEISEQTASDIEEAINRITKSDFKTQLDIHFFTEDKYYDAVEAKFKAKEKELKNIEKEQNDKKKLEKYLRESAKKAGVSYIAPTTPKPETVITEEATLVNEEYGTIEYVYPDPKENQLDIFYVGGYDKYMDYIYNEWLADLKEELTTTSKQLNEHINEVYMNNLDTSGVYGIPTNSVIGNYTWMLLDKQLMDDYLFTADSITSITDENLFRFLNEVKTNEPSVVPATGAVEPTNIYFWSIGAENERLTNEPSVLCGAYKRDGTIAFEDYPALDTLFSTPAYTNQIKSIKRLEWGGYLKPELAEGERAAVTFVKGGYEIYAENHYDPEAGLNGNYYVKMLERPRVDEDDIFAHMLCVNALEDNVARAMEVVTCINIEEEARNIIQYGVEGENYYIDESGVLHRYNQSYMMDINKTGNVFTAHPEEGLPADYWDYGIQQNEDSMVVPAYGLTFDNYGTIDTEVIGAFQDMYGEYMERMNACTNEEELNAFFLAARKEFIDKNGAHYAEYTFITKKTYEPVNDDDPVPLGTAYYKWLWDQNLIFKG